MSESESEDIRKLVGYCRRALGELSTWTAPAGYPDSLALCVIDAIQSIGVRYGSVVKVVGRYRDYRRARGGDAGSDGLKELRKTFEDFDDPAETWARHIGNRHRTSTHVDAPLKATAVYAAVSELATLGVWTTADLRQKASSPDKLSRIKKAWTTVPGQRTGISWYYLLMLAGVENVKADRMIRRFVADGLDVHVDRMPPRRAAKLLRGVADELDVSTRRLDHAAWRYQSGRWRPKARRPG